ncbi:calcium-binding protein [Nocardioides sp. LML1-1-1.1]|uniref:calcium-binding protein n=1 Tax=Nocardioides sp. LML1-1-1.1 TaxID=3135248 RepID=UPI00341CF83A
MSARLLALVSGASLVVVGALAAIAPAQAAAPTCAGRTATIVGTAGDDDLQGTPLPDVVWLGPGNDRFRGDSGNDIICGGAGRDSINGEYGNDIILGESGADRLAGGPGDDSLSGGTGADAFAGGAGDDRINGGRDRDLLTYLTSLHAVTVNGATGTVDGDGHDTYALVETVQGTADADTMVGGPGSDHFVGAAGADRISGGGGADILEAAGGTASGGPGDDLLIVTRGVARGDAGRDVLQLSLGARGYGGEGDDLFRAGIGSSSAYGEAGLDSFLVQTPRATPYLNGGAGDDQVSFETFDRAVRIALGRGVATWARTGKATLRSINIAYGTRFGDTIRGTSGNDYLSGNGGRDALYGLGGTDILDGGKARDAGFGGAGSDICSTEVRRGCEV